MNPRPATNRTGQRLSIFREPRSVIAEEVARGRGSETAVKLGVGATTERLRPTVVSHAANTRIALRVRSAMRIALEHPPLKKLVWPSGRFGPHSRGASRGKQDLFPKVGFKRRVAA